MRRLAATATIVAFATAVLALVGIVLTGTRSSYRVAAIFDTANGIVAGSQVKIAGAAVGSVDNVLLARGAKAQIVMELDRRFTPFRADASCTILPEGIISENYVECDPGSVSAPALPRGSGEIPTVPLSQTRIPLSAQQFLNVFTMPTVARVRVMLDELGITVAGRGGDINALLLRSNPALTQAQRVLAILDRQRAQLADGITQSSRVLDALAAQQQGLREFVDRASAVSTTSAAHSQALAAQFERFPPLLHALHPGLEALDRVAEAGLPILQGLDVAAPALTRMTEILPPFLSAGRRWLPSVAALARVGLRTLSDTRPLVTHLERSTAATVPFAGAMNKFLISSRDSGALEGFLWDIYGQATVFGPYDGISHMGAGIYTAFPQCILTPAPAGCDTQYGQPGNGTVPANDPSCGPTNPEPWAPETGCVGLVPPSGGQPQSQSRHARRRRQIPGASKTSPAQSPLGASPARKVPPPQLPLPVPTAPATPSALQGLLSYLIGR